MYLTGNKNSLIFKKHLQMGTFDKGKPTVNWKISNLQVNIKHYFFISHLIFVISSSLILSLKMAKSLLYNNLDLIDIPQGKKACSIIILLKANTLWWLQNSSMIREIFFGHFTRVYVTYDTKLLRYKLCLPTVTTYLFPYYQ